jgi:hypothetical protein
MTALSQFLLASHFITILISQSKINFEIDTELNKMSSHSLSILSRFGGVTIDGVWIGELDLLTTLSHDS